MKGVGFVSNPSRDWDVDAIVLIVTVSAQECTDGDIFKFLASVTGQRTEVLVIFRGDESEVPVEVRRCPAVITVICILSCGLSHARNIGMNWLLQYNFPETGLVGFPDDDCTYPSDLIDIVRANAKDLGRAFLIGRYGPNFAEVNRKLFPDEPNEISSLGHGRLAASVGLFIPFGALRLVGEFAECLGAGTPLAAAEDTEYVQRLIHVGYLGLYRPNILVYHEYKTRIPTERSSAWLVLTTAYACEDISAAIIALRAWTGFMMRWATRKIGWADCAVVLKYALNLDTYRQLARLRNAARSRAHL